MDGLERNKHLSKKFNVGRDTVGKTAVVGMKNRKMNRVRVEVVERTDQDTLPGFLLDNAADDATVYAD